MFWLGLKLGLQRICEMLGFSKAIGKIVEFLRAGAWNNKPLYLVATRLSIWIIVVIVICLSLLRIIYRLQHFPI
jgi:hypothetical protein